MVAAMAAPPQHSRQAGKWARYLRTAAAVLLCVTLVMWSRLGDVSISSAPLPQRSKSRVPSAQASHPDATPASGAKTAASSKDEQEQEPRGEAADRGDGGDDPGSKVRVGWVGSDFSERRPSGLSMHEAVKVASDNTGNMVWAYGAWQLLDHQRVELVPVMRPPHKADEVAAVLIPTANLLFDQLKYNGSVMVGMTNTLLSIARANRAPSVLLGIGSQIAFAQVVSGEEGAAAGATKPPVADYSVADKVQLARSQMALLERVVGSGGIITTRGAFTARILEANGLPPPLPLGCPSLFLNRDPALGAQLQRKWDTVLAKRSTSLRLAVTLPTMSPHKELPPHADMLALRVLKRFPHSVVVLQTEEDAQSLQRLHEKLGLYLHPDRIRFFYDPRSWVEGLAACCDFVFGFRIHGTMAALAAGVPGIVVSKDYRIKELAEGMKLPTMDLLDFAAAVDLEKFDLFDFAATLKAYKATGFDAHRAEVAAEYVRQFERLGVPLSPEVAAMARGAAPAAGADGS